MAKKNTNQRLRSLLKRSVVHRVHLAIILFQSDYF